MHTSSSSADEFEYLHLQDPGVRAAFIETFAPLFNDLLHITNALVPDHAIRLETLFGGLLNGNSRYSPEKHASFSAWAYQVVFQIIRQSWSRKDRKRTADTLTHLLSNEPYSMTGVEIADALLQREFVVEKQLRQSPHDYPELPDEREEPDIQSLLNQFSDPARDVKPVENQHQGSRPAFPLQEALWLIIGVGIIIVAIFSFNRSDDSDLGVALFPSPTPPLPRLAEIQSQKVITAPISMDPYPGRYFTSSLPAISENGQKIVFVSNSPFIASEDTDEFFDIFLYDVETGEIELVSIFEDLDSSIMTYLYPDITADGVEVAFYRISGFEEDSTSEILIKNMQTYEMDAIPLQHADEKIIYALNLNISADGRVVAFYGQTEEDVPEDCSTEGRQRFCASLFIWSRDENQMYKVPVGAIFSPWTSRVDMTTDGALITLSINEQSELWERVDNKTHETALLYDWKQDRIIPVLDPEEQGRAYWPTISGDGRFVAYTILPADKNTDSAFTSLMLLDRETGERTPITPPLGRYIGNEEAPEQVFFQYGNQPFITADGSSLFYLSKIPVEQAEPGKTFCGTGAYGGKLCLEIYQYDLRTQLSESVDLTPFYQTGAMISIVRFLSASKDGTRIAMALEGGEQDYPCPDGYCSSVWALLENKRGAFVSTDRLRDDNRQTDRWFFKLSLIGVNRWVKGLAMAPGGEWIAAGDQTGAVRFFDPSSTDELFAFEENVVPINTLAVSPDGQMIAAGTQDDSVWLWDTQSRTLITGLWDHPGIVLDASFSPDGKLLAVGSQKALWIWSISDQEIVLLNAYAQDNVNAISFSPDGRWMAVVNQNEVWIRKTQGGEIALRLTGNRAKIKDVAFSPQHENAYILATASINQEVTVWSINKSENHPQAEYLYTLQHHDWVSALAFSPDGSILAAGSFDSYINLWSMPDGTHIQDMQQTRQDQILQLAFSEDGSHLYASTVNGVRIWQNRAAQPADQRITRFFAFADSDRISVSQNYSENYFRRVNVSTETFHTQEDAAMQAGDGYHFQLDIPEPFTLAYITLFRSETGEVIGALSSYIMTTNYEPAQLNIFQTTSSPILNDWPVSDTAVIIESSIADHVAEIIVGGWSVVELNEDSGEASRKWNTGAASLWLRWQDNNTFYSIYFDQPFFAQAIPQKDRFQINDLYLVAQSIYR